MPWGGPRRQADRLLQENLGDVHASIHFQLRLLWQHVWMPRQARIDAPGAFQHIICRGLERKRIFRDDVDRDNFVARMGAILQRTSTCCFAWALIPNHYHLLLQTGACQIATVMERLLTAGINATAIFFRTNLFSAKLILTSWSWSAISTSILFAHGL